MRAKAFAGNAGVSRVFELGAMEGWLVQLLWVGCSRWSLSDAVADSIKRILSKKKKRKLLLFHMKVDDSFGIRRRTHEA